MRFPRASAFRQVRSIFNKMLAMIHAFISNTDITRKQRYAALGNSLNVRVASAVLRYLLSEPLTVFCSMTSNVKQDTQPLKPPA